jgi:uncharacterized RDD family membrane protein YckC
MTVRELSRQTGKEILLYRWLGAWIDFVVFWIILILAELALGSELYQRTVWLWVVVALAYFPITERLTGKTLGKKMASLIVVDEAGRLPTVSQVVKRTIARLLEVNPLGGGLIAAIVVLATKDHQRLGDLWADTFVVRVDALRESQRAAPPALDSGELPAQRREGLVEP